MNVKKFSWTRPLALFVALTMIMMYSVTGMAFADINDAQVHYKGSVPGDIIVIETTIEGIFYVAEAEHSTGFNYVGAFKSEGVLKPLPVNNSFKLTDVASKIYIKNTLQILEIDRSSATGGDSLNIFVKLAGAPPYYDLGVTKSVEDGTVEVGENVTFTITVTNNSDMDVEDVTVNDTLPTGLTLVSAVAQQGSFADNVWTVGDMDADETTTLTIIATANTAGTFENTATVVVQASDAVSENNSDTASVTVTNPPVPVRDLAVMKTVNDNTVTVGDTVKFTIMAQNIGNTSMESVTVQDILPAGLSQSGVTFSDNTNFVGSTWTIGTLGANEVKYLTISAVTLTVGPVSNTATGSGTDDVDNTNNSSTVEVVVSAVVVTPTYDLDITKVVDDNTVAVGDEVKFTITARNLGNTTINDVIVTDTLPAGLSLSGVTYSERTTFSGVTWEIDDIEPNEFKTLTISAIAQEAGEFTNVAVGTSSEDEASDNNTDSATVTVTLVEEPDRDLGITKTVNLGNVVAGTGVTFTVTILNNGDTTYEGIEVRDTWPAGLTQGTATPPEGTTFDVVNNIWEVGTIGPGEAKVLTITAGTPATGTFTNLVAILFGEYEGDDNSNNNTASAIVNVTTEDDDDNNTPTRRTTPTPPADIPEEEPPLVDAPVIEPEIVDEPAPLADVPQTDDTSNIFLLLGLMLASGAGIAALGRRKETVEK